MTALPIPVAAFDDRLGFLGTSGSGKTYGAGDVVERLLDRKSRVVITDPLGVWYGLRLNPDGKTPSAFDVVIFGGPHGDLPITPLSGGLIGETVAKMAESCIIDMSELGTKAAERRFMLAFLEGLYRHATKEPLHVVFDETDMWAPQKLLDKDGEAAKLVGMMETIVRRGRVKGFIPWLISQRPAVVNKDILSQVDGLAIFKLTSSHDRDAVGAWVEGQAEKGEWSRIYDALPAKEIGHAVVWLPAHGILKDDAAFPVKATFDSSATPKRGQKRRPTAELKPLDLGKLKEKLATIEAETKANDPKALKAENARLTRELAAAQKGRPAASAAAKEKIVHVADPKAVAAADKAGFVRGRAVGQSEGYIEATKLFDVAIERLHGVQEKANNRIADLAAATEQAPPAPAASSVNRIPERAVPSQPVSRTAPMAKVYKVPATYAAKLNGAGDASLTGPQQQLLRAMAWWKRMGHDKPSRAQIAGIAGWKITSGHLKNVVGSLRSSGLVSYPDNGRIELTEAGAAAAPDPDMSVTLHDGIRSALNGPQRQVFDVLLGQTEDISREDIAAACGWEPTSGHLKNIIGSMRTLEIISYPASGRVALQEWVTA